MLPAVNGEELKQFVPELLEARYPGRSRPADPETSIVPGGPHMGWILDLDECVALVRASQATNPFILIRGGIAHAIPKSEALAFHVAANNKHLMVGRAYVGYGNDVALVAFDESIDGSYLSLDNDASIQDAVTRFEMSLRYTAAWTQEIVDTFGGRRFTADDIYLVSL
jgi:hypothetical protein